MNDMRCDTVKVQNPDEKGGYMIINRSDYEADHAEGGEKKYKLHSEQKKEEKALAEGEEPEREGLSHENETYHPGRNASGTFDEPTPSNINYPDKDATEFENNHGAFVGQSAAELRETMGMKQKPGGLDPSKHEEVKKAQAGLAKIGEPSEPHMRVRRPGGLERKRPEPMFNKSRRKTKRKGAKSKRAATHEETGTGEGDSET